MTDNGVYFTQEEYRKLYETIDLLGQDVKRIGDQYLEARDLAKMFYKSVTSHNYGTEHTEEIFPKLKELPKEHWLFE